MVIVSNGISSEKPNIGVSHVTAIYIYKINQDSDS